VVCFFASDLHGRLERYLALFQAIERERPEGVFLGGDLLPPLHGSSGSQGDFVTGFLTPGFERLRQALGPAFPSVFLILGNDDCRATEELVAAPPAGLWQYAHLRRLHLGPHAVYGYACVPPTPFRLKDWERYDVSRYLDPGCISPEEGWRSVPVPPEETRWATMAQDLEHLAGDDDVSNAVLLLHAPPYRSALDRAGLDGRSVDHAPLDVHVGSIAVRRFIEARQPLLALHGHVHESARITGSWQDRIGRTLCLSAAHDGPELALVRFRLEEPERASRSLSLPASPA
jgi:Icc-related predicted phosphoesterase